MSNKARLKKKKRRIQLRKRKQVQPVDKKIISETLQSARDFHRSGNYIKAEESYIKAISLDPSNANVHYFLGTLYQQTGKIELAARSYSRSLIIKPDTTANYRSLSEVLRTSNKLPDSIGSGKDRKLLLINCLQRNDINLQTFFYPCLAELLREDITGEIRRFNFSEKNYTSFHHFFFDSPLQKLLTDPLLHLLLKRTLVVDQFLESFLQRVRKTIAMVLADKKFNEHLCDQLIPLACALAHQCFINEYIYQQDEKENKYLSRIKTSLLGDKEAITNRFILSLALLGCYEPLNTYDFPEDFPDVLAIENKDLAELIQVQVIEPRKEKELSESIKSFARIKDATSQQVQHMYEENPYPRWVSMDLQTQPLPFTKRLEQEIAPNSPFDLHEPEQPKVLVAGCGTGLQAISCAATYLNSSVLAIDLSRTSLAYARRKADEFGIKNIEFMQCDILDLAQLNKSFDIIECAGVLHHMKVPEEGLRVLTGLLKRSGYMLIGLYSEIARQEIVKAQEFVQEQSLEPTPEGIRKFRQALFTYGDDRLKHVPLVKDLFTTSTIRDLFFHVQEHRFTLPDVSSLLDKFNLEFLGFNLNMSQKKGYLTEYADDRAATSLDSWNSYELKHPETFLEMYVFWVRNKNKICDQHFYGGR